MQSQNRAGRNLSIGSGNYRKAEGECSVERPEVFESVSGFKS